MDLPTYDLESVYDEQIYPLMQQILEICQKHRMPMMASFQYANHEEGPDFCTSILSGGDFPAHPSFRAAAELLKPQAPLTLASTITTGPDGKKTLHIQRI
jgi:hypothetical protein